MSEESGSEEQHGMGLRDSLRAWMQAERDWMLYQEQALERRIQTLKDDLERTRTELEALESRKEERDND